MSILKAADAAGSACNRYTFDLAPIAGEARFIHTYKCDGNPIPSFEGEPERIAVPEGCIDCFTKAVWNSLNEDNKVSLFVRFVDLESGEAETRIINKNN